MIQTFEGTVEGEIAHEPRGSNGFGYDPIFLLPELNRTMAELSGSEKLAISHRGHALRKMSEYLAIESFSRHRHSGQALARAGIQTGFVFPRNDDLREAVAAEVTRRILFWSRPPPHVGGYSADPSRLSFSTYQPHCRRIPRRILTSRSSKAARDKICRNVNITC